MKTVKGGIAPPEINILAADCTDIHGSHGVGGIAPWNP
jgi:hypothetical protein